MSERVSMSMSIEEYAEHRKLPLKFLTTHGLRVAEPGEVNAPGKWLAIPYPNVQGVWYTRYRNLDPTDSFRWWQPKGSKQHLYNPKRLGPNADEVWITEGEFDALTLCFLGFDAVGISGVNAWKTSWTLLYSECQVIVAMDGDKAGRDGAFAIASQFKDNARVLELAEGEDMNGLLLSLGDVGLFDKLHEWKDSEGI